MTTKTFKGKAIYNPSGKAGEYSYWACNFFVGCSNDCTYCYLRKGRGAAVLGGNKPELKKCFRDEKHAMEVFEHELSFNIVELQKHGLFFSFTTDPMLPETRTLTARAIDLATDWHVPVKILTKRADWLDYILPMLPINWHHQYAFGFTLTGHDELEPGASTNAERIAAMKKLHDAGFRTFASIEPVIDFESSLQMIKETTGSCDLYKIGLMSGKKYNKKETRDFMELINVLSMAFGFKVYWKDSLLSAAGQSREEINAIFPNCVGRDYNMFAL